MQQSFLQFIAAQLARVPPVTTQDLTGKTIVVVGANVGLGFEATKHFAQMNPGRLILACRSKSKGEAALEKIKQETGCKTAELRIVDLSSFASVDAFVEKFNKEVDQLDILILNAAVIPPTVEPTTQDGWETTLQTNYLSPSLLSLLLLPKMIETASTRQTLPRLVVVSSDMHYSAKFQKKMVESPNPLRVFGSTDYFNPPKASFMENVGRYQDSKLLNVFFTRALASHVGPSQSSSVIVDTVNPGYCYSNIRQFKNIFARIFDFLMEKALARTTEEGARQLIWAALASQGGDERALHGAYISEMNILEPADSVVGEGGKILEDKLWADLISELEQVNPKVREIVTKYLN